MRKTSFLIVTLVCLLPAFAQSTRIDDPEKVSVALYPILGWLPSFSSSVTVPPATGGGPVDEKTDRSINGAIAFGADVTFKKWLVEGEATFANVSSSRTTPLVDISTTLHYGDLFVGRYVGKGFYALGGVRRMALNFDVKVASLPSFSRKPGVWDPLVGVEYRRALGNKVLVQLRADGGGFGVGSDLDVDAQARLEWRFIKHLGVALGYQALHTRTSGTVSQSVLNTTVVYPWKYNQTFLGPIVGVGIYF